MSLGHPAYCLVKAVHVNSREVSRKRVGGRTGRDTGTERLCLSGGK